MADPEHHEQRAGPAFGGGTIVMYATEHISDQNSFGMLHAWHQRLW